jgi:hypothetical protein
MAGAVSGIGILKPPLGDPDPGRWVRDSDSLAPLGDPDSDRWVWDRDSQATLRES